MKEYSDIEIIDCLRNRQSYVVHYLTSRYLPMIRLLVTQMGGNTEDAKDIFQEGLMIMIEKIDDRSFMLTCKFKTLLYCICKHLWESILTKRKAADNYFRKRINDENREDIAEPIDYETYGIVFTECYNSLDEVSRRVLRMYWDELSPQTIAEQLGYSYGYVRKKKCEAQNELVTRIKRHPVYIRIMHSDQKAKSPVT